VIGSLFRPWTTVRTWRALANVALDLPFGVITFTFVVTLLAMTLGLLITFPLAIVTGMLLLYVSDRLGRVERARAAALLDVDYGSPHPPLAPGSWWNRLWQRLRNPSRWREMGYHVLRLPVSVIAFVVVVVLWASALAMTALPAYVSALPGHTAEFGLFSVGHGASAIAVCVVGVSLLLVVAPWTTVAFGALDGAIVRWLLAPPRDTQLAAQLTRVESSRAAAVESAESERRRIERDLHDGAQQRLVKLGMDLGMARETFDQDPAAARQLVADAHEEAKAALAELRDLVRGFHPAILEDRGLDAALSAVVARSPVPVTLRVDIPVRPPATIESAAYFVVVEALTNVAKHAGATKASVTIERRGDRLGIDISDDGVGGANVQSNGGLHGLAERVEALGGWMRVLSPAGGPTTLMAELPCAS
jgi:signal transduction histidine kinase